MGSISLDLSISDEADVAAPTLPAFANVLAAYGLNNFNPEGYPAGAAISDANQEGSSTFTEVSPYPFTTDFVPPILVSTWYDQNGNNNLLGSVGSVNAPPTLQTTTPVIVSGAGTAAANGEYHFIGVVNGKGKYQLGADVDSFVVWVDGVWSVRISALDDVGYISEDDVAFPWQAAWVVTNGDGPAPTVAAGTQNGQIDFDGVAAALQSNANLALSTVTSIYCRVKLPDLSNATNEGELVETTANGITTTGGINIRLRGDLVAGRLEVAVKAAGGLNVKRFTLADTNYHLLTVIIDTAAAVANQVQLWVDGSSVGVTAGTATDLAGLTLANDKLNVGARNNGAANPLLCSMTDLLIFSVAHNTTLREQWEAYINSLYS
jgi:hypothetical protein